MIRTYKYNRGGTGRHIVRHLLIVLGIPLVILVVVIGLIARSDGPKQQPVISGGTKIVPQSISKDVLRVNQPLFSLQLPSDWKQTSAQDTQASHSISWQATTKGTDNRYLTLYIDTIPTTKPVNLELPVSVSGNQLSYGALSDNCSDFTPGGTMDVGKAEVMPPAPSLWQGVNFICNIPEVLLDQVGTGSIGSPNNTVTVTGPTSGTHKYFFLYTDLNIDPDYSILFNAIQSFRAK
jgi:hypothetical protein